MADHDDTARPRFGSGNAGNTMAAPLGMMSDEPRACTTRHSTNNSTPGESAAATDANVKSAVPASSACRAPHRRANAAPMTNVAAPTMVKMLTAHDNVAEEESGNESSRSGKTTNTIDSAIAI